MTAYLYRVRWHRPSWKPGRYNAKLYSQRSGAEQLVARLTADTRYSHVSLDRREVLSAWSPITTRTPVRQRWAPTPTPEPVDVTVNVW